jgi:transaldolase
MTGTYFSWMKAETPTRVWVNNPTREEVALALAQGAVGCTTNPAFGGGLLKRAPDEIRPIIAECAAIASDDLEAADLVQQRLVARIAERFRPVHEATGGKLGFVSIQGAPEADTDPERILAEGRQARTIGPNVTPKLPATAAGLEALDVLVREGSPIIVTEVFSLAQLVEVNERYLAATARTGVRPPFFISPITGIFGDHLKAIAARDEVPLDPADAEQVGVALSRACQKLVEERGYPAILLCGGARIPLDLTGLVGGALHVTINWSTFADVLATDTAREAGINTPLDEAALGRLTATFEDVGQAFRLGGLTLDEFESFGPVQQFRNNFIAGWQAVLAAVRVERADAIGR